MSEHVQQTIQLVQEQIASLEADLVERKRMVNSLCSLVKQPPIYPDADLRTSTVRPVRPDEYYGQPISTAIRMVLERRQIANVGPATVNEIYDSLVAGGYNFQTKNDDYAKRNLYTTLTKNSSVFHRLPNGLWGLLEWYPDAKTAKTPKPSNGAKGETADVAASAEDDETPFNTDEAAEAALSEADARPAGKVVAKK